MLYTFSQTNYDSQLLGQYAQAATAADALLFWQDGVWALSKYAEQLHGCRAAIYVLQQDLAARNLDITQFAPHLTVYSLSLPEWVSLTERYFPQLAR
ncbi:DsrH/TusB family sulfur relay protein [Testudinibacter sp. P80/BLE/0925]|uniref:DsrH/TusB family sulfur relay protein n=1 Tax=Testudinibacter sp. TW-1 TaxID=3417757 RepID=UPI003D35B79A